MVLITLEDRLIKECQKLDRDKIHLLYWIYDFSFHNIYHSPLLLGTKILGVLKGKQAVDHVCHISRFNYDEEKKCYRPKIFEASVDLGMVENDLIERLKYFRGALIIETLGKVDKEEARKFEKRYRGLPYSKKGALFSGLDIKLLDKIVGKDGERFCSWLEAKFLLSQNYKIEAEGGNPSELTPMDLFNEDFARKRIFYKYRK
jgi:hypothetical protein